jgi:DnaJ-class molecular chaperone
MVECPGCNGHGYLILERRVGDRIEKSSLGCAVCRTQGRVTELEAAAHREAAERCHQRAKETVANWKRRN